jgi:hypothetical protein
MAFINLRKELNMSIARITEMLSLKGTDNVSRHVFQLISSDGKGGGTVDLNQNAAADYYFIPDPNEKIRLERMNVFEVDGSFTNAAGYGAGTALTNGIGITVENADGVLKNYTPVRIKTTYEWALLAGVDSTFVGGAGSDPHMVRWTFAKGGGPILLDGSKGEFLRVSFGDAMDFLTLSKIMVQGHRL